MYDSEEQYYYAVLTSYAYAVLFVYENSPI
jgi:hypothetical protein